MKYCEECRFCLRPAEASNLGPSHYRCAASKNTRGPEPGIQFVTRAQTPPDTIARFCVDLRLKDAIEGRETCGPDGKWFEAIDEV